MSICDIGVLLCGWQLSLALLDSTGTKLGHLTDWDVHCISNPSPSDTTDWTTVSPILHVIQWSL